MRCPAGRSIATAGRAGCWRIIDIVRHFIGSLPPCAFLRCPCDREEHVHESKEIAAVIIPADRQLTAWKRMRYWAIAHAVDDFYQGIVPAGVPFFVLERGYSYTAASGLALAA